MATRKLKMYTLIALAVLMVFVTACSNTNNGGSENETAPTEHAGNSNAANTEADPEPAPAASAEGPFGKYEPEITIRSVGSVSPGAKYLPDQTKEDNVWTREFKSELGINLKYDWIVNSTQYDQKLTVTMASGDLPDYFTVNTQQFQTLAQAGQLADLTQVWEEYASDQVKEFHAESDGIKYKVGTIDGKLQGIALNGGNLNDAHSMYIRKDWLENLGREVPKTMDEVYDLAIAFTKEDPDGNGKDDTYGLAVTGTLWGGFAGLDGIFNSYGAYPYNASNKAGTNLFFLKDESGKAVWADVQPEVKTALVKIRELYAAGAIHPEFSVMDERRVGDLAKADQVGIAFGAFYVPTYPIQNMHKENPERDWVIAEVPSATGTPTVLQSNNVATSFLVVNKNSEHPEAAIKMMNYATSKLSGDVVEMDKYHTITKDGENYNIHGFAIRSASADGNQLDYERVVAALDKQDPSGLPDTARSYYDAVMAFRGGDTSQWTHSKLWDHGGIFEVLGKYKAENRIITSVYTGAPTPTTLDRGAALRDAQVRAFTEIIMGAKELDYFDEWVEQWYAQGGQEILDEVNASGQVQ